MTVAVVICSVISLASRCSSMCVCVSVCLCVCVCVSVCVSVCVCDRSAPNPNAVNINIVADLYAEVIGVLAQSRY